MEHPPTAITYRPEIDGLRALAVTVVVLFHAGLGFTGGFVGVDIFFVISGFLITSLLLKDLDAGAFSIVNFYERRVRRILPASLVVTALVLAAGWRWMLPSDFEWLGLSAVWHAACAANVFFMQRTSNYFAGSAAEMPLLHMWSLAVEEQFYLVFPLLLWGCYRLGVRGRQPIRWIILGVGLGSYILSVRGLPIDPNGTFYLLHTRAWELMLGGWLATRPACGRSRAARETASWIGLLSMVVPAWFYSAATAFPGSAAVPPCVGAALYIWSGGAASRAEGGADQVVVARLLSTRGPVFVGAISYSLYLYHWPILAFDKYRAVAPASVSHRLLLVAFAVVLAILSWRFVETPFRTKRWGGRRWRLFAGAAAGLAAVAIGGWRINAKDGLPSRFSAAVIDLDQVRRTSLHLAQLEADDVPANLTPMGVADDGVPVSVLLWGDSHAGAQFQAFNDFCKSRGLKGRAATHSGRAPLMDFTIGFRSFERWQNKSFSRAVLKYVTDEHVANVFLVDFWERDFSGSPILLGGQLQQTIEELNRAGATVYVVMQEPSYEVEVPRALAFEAIAGRTLDGWRKTLAEHRREQQVMIDLAAKLESAKCHFIDPSKFFQRKGDPFLTVADRGRPIYKDAHHLTPWGARKLIGAFLNAAVPATQAASATAN